jgi:hypothetical protein
MAAIVPRDFGYELWWTTDTGARIAAVTRVFDAEFLRVANDAGRFSMRVPSDQFTLANLKRDQMIVVWRKARGDALGLFRVYFIRKWEFRRSGSRFIVTISGPDSMDLLKRRLVVNFAGTGEATKDDHPDDMAKEIVDEQMVNDASDPGPDAGSRDYANLTVQADLSAIASVTRSFPWQNVFKVIQSLAKATRAAGNEMFFDVVPIIGTNTISFQFQTKTGQPGNDLASQVVFDEARGNLKESVLTYDSTDEVNYIYAGGLGQEDNRNIQQAYDAARYNASAWNRREGWAYAVLERTDAGVQDVADAALQEGEPRLTFSALPIDTEGTRLGVHWNFGDKVTARFLGQEYQTIIRKVKLRLTDDGREVIESRMEYSE